MRHLADEEARQDLDLFGTHDVLVVGRLAGEFAIKCGQEPSLRRVDEKPADPVQKFIAGGSVNRPFGVEGFSPREDLFDDNPGRRRRLAEPPQIGGGSRSPSG